MGWLEIGAPTLYSIYNMYILKNASGVNLENQDFDQSKGLLQGYFYSVTDRSIDRSVLVFFAPHKDR